MTETTGPAPLEQENRALREENRELRARLDAIDASKARAGEVRKKVFRGVLPLLVPLLDRQHVVRSFGQLVKTVSGFAGERSGWPSRDQVIDDARLFSEACVRFAIRRRTIMLLLGLAAGLVPAIQIWLVVQQNAIMDSQTELARIQIYDVIASSMTQGDRNSKLMTGALLANARLEFLGGVVEETFDPDLQNSYEEQSHIAGRRRIEDAAFRGYLLRALVRGVEHEHREGRGNRDLFLLARPMFKRVLADGAYRLPALLMSGRQAEGFDDSLAEEADFYIVQTGSLLRTYARLAESAGRERVLAEDIGPFFKRLSERQPQPESRFWLAYKTSMQDFLFDFGGAPDLDDPAVDVQSRRTTPDKALAAGLKRLRATLGEKAANWPSFERQVALR